MHEFLLYSQIPAARHGQVLQILAGITAAQPIKFSEQHVVYQQIKGAQTAATKKGQAAQLPRAAQLSYCKLVRDCLQDGDPGPWKMRKEEQPFAGVNDAISRTAAEHVAGEAELERFNPDSEWYRRVAQFIVTGCHFVQENVVIRVVRAYGLKQAAPEDPLTTPPPQSADLRPLDGSGAYIIEASLRTTDDSGSELREKAKKELLAFCKGLEGSIDFYAPDRLVLDTRVRGS